jgi:hypothetical protein
MTVGGLWAVVPDLPRIFREDLPGAAMAAILGAKSLENWLHERGDVFFFHRSLDADHLEFALHGLALILLFYNLAIVLLMARDRHRRRLRKGRPDPEDPDLP